MIHLFKIKTMPPNCVCIVDPEPFVQEQALALVRNLVDGCIDSVEYVFAEDALLLHAIGRQLQNALESEVLIQVSFIYIFCMKTWNSHLKTLFAVERERERECGVP